MKKLFLSGVTLARLHFSVFLFSTTGIFSKLLANSFNQNGFWHPFTFLYGSLILMDCAVYAFVWQRVLSRMDVHVAYSHKAVSNIWNLIWAVFLFSEPVSAGNIAGTLMIIIGVMIVESG